MPSAAATPISLFVPTRPPSGRPMEISGDGPAARVSRRPGDQADPATGAAGLDLSEASPRLLGVDAEPDAGKAPAAEAEAGEKDGSGPGTAELPTVTVGGDAADGKRGRRATRPKGLKRRTQYALAAALTSHRGWALLVVAGLTAVFALTPLGTVWRNLLDDKEDVGTLKTEEDTSGQIWSDITDPTTKAAEQIPTVTATGDALATKKPVKTEKSTKTGGDGGGGGGPVAGTVGNLAKRSGLPWGSGVYIPGSDPAKIAEFENWRGRQIDVVVDWPARQSWGDITNPDWIFRSWASTPYTKALGIPPFPEGGGSLQECATGAYDGKWREMATNFKNSGMAGETIVRLGWEMNGDWYAWSAHDPSAFAACFRKVVTAAESVAPELRWDWTVNRGPGQSVTDAAKAYPGDAYVDIVGIDSYDQFPGVTNESNWQVHYSGPYGLKYWTDFAKRHGKKIIVPEWGVYPGADSNGGDNPFYIGKMRNFFASLGSQLAYEAYFNESADYYRGAIFGPTQNPSAAAKYASLF
jgi:hypothetical protein